MILKNTAYLTLFSMPFLLQAAAEKGKHTVGIDLVVFAQGLDQQGAALRKKSDYNVIYRNLSHGLGPTQMFYDQDIIVPKFTRFAKFVVAFDHEPTMGNVTQQLEKIAHSIVIPCGITIEHPKTPTTKLKINGINMHDSAVINDPKVKVNEHINRYSNIWSKHISGNQNVPITGAKRLSYYSTPIPGGIYRKLKNRELTGNLIGKRF